MKTRNYNRNQSIDAIWASYGKTYAGWLTAIVEFADSVVPPARRIYIKNPEAMLYLAKVLNDGKEPDASVPAKKLEEILGEFPTTETILSALNECRKVFESFVAVNNVAFKGKMYGMAEFVAISTDMLSPRYEDVDMYIEQFKKDLDSIIGYYEESAKTALPTDFIQ